jgi:hypothetical protein
VNNNGNAGSSHSKKSNTSSNNNSGGSNNNNSGNNNMNSNDPKMKNFGSWSSLAQNANQGSSGVGGNKTGTSLDSFQQFKKAAKEKQDRQRQLLEQQEIRRIEKERADRERLRLEKERQREREEEEALERMRKGLPPSNSMMDEKQLNMHSPAGSISPASGSSSPAQTLTDRDIQRRREQERRRREAVSFPFPFACTTQNSINNYHRSNRIVILGLLFLNSWPVRST